MTDQCLLYISRRFRRLKEYFFSTIFGQVRGNFSLSSCEEIKEKHIYAFSVFPKMKDSDDVRINKIMNKKKETPRDKYFRMRETAFKKK